MGVTDNPQGQDIHDGSVPVSSTVGSGTFPAGTGGVEQKIPAVPVDQEVIPGRKEGGESDRAGRVSFIMKIIGGGVVLAIGGIAVSYYFVHKDDGYRDIASDSGEIEFTSDVVEVLRTYEISWGPEEIQKWEERRGYPLDYIITYAREGVPRFQKDRPICSVGSETLYTDDISYYLILFHYDEFTSGDQLSDSLLREVVTEVVEQSIALQEGEKQTLVVLSDEWFNTPDRNYTLRNETFTELEERIDEYELSVVRGTFISTWFNNMATPVMSVEEAREYSEELITDLRAKVAEEALTMEEAGDAILSDPVMMQIDLGLSGNAYSTFSLYGDSPQFHDPDVEEQVRALSEGELSDVIMGREQGASWYDAYFMVVYVEEKQEGTGGYEEWLEEAKDSYEVKLIEHNT